VIDLFRPYVDERARVLVDATLRANELGRTYIGEGPRVAEFEAAFAREIELRGAPILALNSCTSAIDLALHLCGVGPGDEVITTPMTCSATNTHIVLRGATPVWADVDPITGLIDPMDVDDKTTEKTKAIIAVDWAGRRCNYEALKDIWQYQNPVNRIPIIQDAAHTPFASGGDYTCDSFQAIKALTTGDGGALLVPPGQYERARLLRWYGLDRTQGESFRCSQNIQSAGFKYHMNDISASIGLGNLPELKRIVQAHRDNAAYYHRNLDGLSGVTVPPSDPDSAWWLYTLLVDDRDSFIAHMAQAGIECSPVHSRNDRHDAFHFPNGPLPGVDSFAAHEVAIPVGWWLGIWERATIVSQVHSWAYAHARVPA